jgi:uncharacterized protein YkwD
MTSTSGAGTASDRPATPAWVPQVRERPKIIGSPSGLTILHSLRVVSQCDDYLIGLFNAARGVLGLPALTQDFRAAAAAAAHAGDVAARLLPMTAAVHTGSDGSDVGRRLNRAGIAWSGAAEIAAPLGPTPESALEMWRNSTSHWPIIIGDYTHAGAAFADVRDTAGNLAARYWISCFYR